MDKEMQQLYAGLTPVNRQKVDTEIKALLREQLLMCADISKNLGQESNA